MPRVPRLPARAQRIPWQMVLTLGVQVVQEGRRRWDRLTPREQRDLQRILRDSRGRPGKVTARDRAELRRIVWKAVGPDR